MNKALTKDEGVTPLVSALDPRFELKSSLESSRTAQLNRQNILRAQISQLEAELHASVETTDSCDEQIIRLADSLEASRQLALGNS